MKEDPAMPVVLNAKKVGRHQEGAVYIGRPSTPSPCHGDVLISIANEEI